MVGSGSAIGTRVDVTLKLAQLQNLCKRDPAAYRDDYDAQVRRLESECTILQYSSSTSNTTTVGGGQHHGGGGHNHALVELIQFAAAVSSSSYKGAESDRIANLLIHLLLGNTTTTTMAESTTSTTPTAAAKATAVSKVEQQHAVANVTSHLSAWALSLSRDVRKACVSALILMRNKGAMDPLRVILLFFRLLAVIPDKALREILYKHMVNDIRNINKKGKRDDHLNRAIQSFLHRVVSTHGSASSHSNSINNHGVEEAATDIAAKRATDMVCELYRRNVWTDERTVAILTSACASQNSSVMAKAMRFFLNIEETMAHDTAAAEDQEVSNADAIDYHMHSKKTQGRLRHVQRQIKNKKKLQKKREGMDGGENYEAHIRDDKGAEGARKLYPAIELIHNPQGLAEAVFQRLRRAGSGNNNNNSTTSSSSSSSLKYETKLLMINFVTRLVGNHELMLLALYPFLQKYMGGHQRNVTAILAYTVQACHEHVPPEEVHAILKTIAHNFITERCSEEQMAVGINAARAICARVPTVLTMTSIMSASAYQDKKKKNRKNKKNGTDKDDGDDDDDNTPAATMVIDQTSAVGMDTQAFARDLAGFANHRDRSVAIAGKAWTNFIREVHPALLQGKQRGLKGSALYKAGAKPRQFGEEKVSFGVEGADLLVEYESKKAAYLKKKKQEAAAGRNTENETGQDDKEDEDEDEDGWVEVADSAGGRNAENDTGHDGNDDGDHEDDEEDEEDGWVEVADSEDESAPDLMALPPATAGDEKTSTTAAKASVGDDGEEEKEAVEQKRNEGEDVDDEEDSVIDLSKMTPQEREKLRLEVSANRVFTAADFEKMRKLVEREKRAKQDPREAARRKRAIARGEEFAELSGDDDISDNDSDEEDNIRVAGAVNPTDIMATATKKRQSKAERLAKVVGGREKFESMARSGGSTNVEKKRTKNFVMSKFGREARTKGKGKTMLTNKRKGKSCNNTHENKKRRRKM